MNGNIPSWRGADIEKTHFVVPVFVESLPLHGGCVWRIWQYVVTARRGLETRLYIAQSYFGINVCPWATYSVE